MLVIADYIIRKQPLIVDFLQGYRERAIMSLHYVATKVGYLKVLLEEYK